MDVTVILNAHSEGLLAHPACLSIEMARQQAERNGIQVEVVAVLDRPTADTAEFFSTRAPRAWRLVETAFGDIGQARNEGVRLAHGRWIAFLDADDLFGANWLAAAYAAAQRESRLVVWHPEVNLYFGADRYIFRHIDMDEEFDPAGLMCSNYWTALCFAPRTLLEQTPYPPSRLDRQIGFEDWAWNRAVIARGAIHKIAPGTGHMIRVKQGSLVRQTTARASIPAPNGFFKSLLG